MGAWILLVITFVAAAGSILAAWIVYKKSYQPKLEKLQAEALYHKGVKIGFMALSTEGADERKDLRKEGLEFIKQAIELQPGNHHFLFAKGWILDEMDHFVEAIEAYNASKDLNPKGANITYNIACSYARWGKLEEALEELKKIKNERVQMEYARTDPDFEALRKSSRHRNSFSEITKLGESSAK